MGQIFPNNNVLLSDFGWEIVQMVLVDMTKKSLVDYYMFIMRDTVKIRTTSRAKKIVKVRKCVKLKLSLQKLKVCALIVTFKSNLIKHLINTLTPSILPCWVWWQHLLDCRMEGDCIAKCAVAAMLTELRPILIMSSKFFSVTNKW